jgi:hypothetical protein
MTVASTTNPARNDYTGNGSTTVYNFTFPVLKESNRADNKEYSIKVIITENAIDTVKTETTDYTVTLDEDTRLGTITFGTAPTATQKITFISDVDVSQATDYNKHGTGAFPVDSHEKALDKLTILFRQSLEKENRAVFLPASSNLSNLQIPVSSDNADKAIVINSTGDNLEAKNLADIGTAPVTDFAKTLLDDTTNTQARTTLDAEQKTNSLTEKSSVVADDKFIIADSEDSNNSKKVSYNNFLSASETQKGLSILNKPITIANNSSDSEHDIDFSAGVINFDDGTGQTVATALTKKLDASWVAGTNQGGLDTGSISANTWYYCFAIYNPTTSTADFLFSASYSSPTLPSGYTKKEYRGAVLTDASSNIRNGKWSRNEFEFTASVTDSTNVINTSQATRTLSVPPTNVKAQVSIYIAETGVNVTSHTIVQPTWKGNIGTINSSTATISQGTDGDDISRPVRNNVEISLLLFDSQVYTKSTTSLNESTLKTVGYKDLNIKF